MINDVTGYVTTNVIDRFVWKCGMPPRCTLTAKVGKCNLLTANHEGNSNLVVHPRQDRSFCGRLTFLADWPIPHFGETLIFWRPKMGFPIANLSESVALELPLTTNYLEPARYFGADMIFLHHKYGYNLISIFLSAHINSSEHLRNNQKTRSTIYRTL